MHFMNDVRPLMNPTTAARRIFDGVGTMSTVANVAGDRCRHCPATADSPFIDTLPEGHTAFRLTVSWKSVV